MINVIYLFANDFGLSLAIILPVFFTIRWLVDQIN
jgi:hypothetical protein